jgi:hypothetical protein
MSSWAKIAYFMIVDMTQQVALGNLSPQVILMNCQLSQLKVRNPHVKILDRYDFFNLL